MNTTGRNQKPIRIGIVGVGRGISFAQESNDRLGMELVALCDTWEDRLQEAGSRFGVTTYQSYDRFLEHEMDAVILANYFNEHAPLPSRRSRQGCT